MRNKLFILVLVLSLTFNAAVIGALVYHLWLGRSVPFPGRGWLVKDGFPDGELSLSAEQSEAIESLHERLEKESYPIRSRIYTCRQELFELLRADSPDSAALSAMIDEINALQRRMQATVVDYMLREREFLDEEQRQIFFGRMRGRMCPGGGPGGMGPLLGRCHNGHGRERHAR